MCHVRPLPSRHLLKFAKPCVHAIQVVRPRSVRCQASHVDLGSRVPVGCVAGVLHNKQKQVIAA